MSHVFCAPFYNWWSQRHIWRNVLLICFLWLVSWELSAIDHVHPVWISQILSSHLPCLAKWLTNTSYENIKIREGWAVLPFLRTLHVFSKNLTWPHQLYLAFFFLTDLMITSEFDFFCSNSRFYWMGCPGWNHCCFLCPYCHHNKTLVLHAQTSDKSFSEIHSWQ